MKIEMILSALSKIFPRELVTLSSWSYFHVNYEAEHIIITTNRSQYSINESDFLDFFSTFLSRRSFFVKDYQYEYKYVPYLLPIIEVVLENSFEDLSQYYTPKKMFSHGRNYKKGSCNINIGVFEFLDGVQRNYSYERVLKSTYISSINKSNKEELNVLVEVHYATNRKYCGNIELFSGERQDTTKYGVVNVSIPKNVHKSGNVERPSSILKFVLKENKNKHFLIDSSRGLTESEFRDSLIDKSKNKSMMIFIHGYNVSFKNALYKSAQIKYDLMYQWPMLLFSWPSKGNIKSYQSDRENALYSAKCLSKLLELIQSLGVEEVIVVAHSMGTFCLSEALSKVNKETSFQRLVLAAADIEKEAFTTHYVEDINRVFKDTTLYMSSTDMALIASDFVNESNRVGDARDDILVVQNMESIDMSNLDKGVFSLGHSYVSENNRALDDLYYFLVQGAKASTRRLKSLFNKSSESYWTLHT